MSCSHSQVPVVVGAVGQISVRATVDAIIVVNAFARHMTLPTAPEPTIMVLKLRLKSARMKSAMVTKYA